MVDIGSRDSSGAHGASGEPARGATPSTACTAPAAAVLPTDSTAPTASAVAEALTVPTRLLGEVSRAGLVTQEGASGSDLVDLLGRLAVLVAAAEACAARTATELDRVRRAEESEAGIPAARRGRGVAAEVGLARRESAHRGRVMLGFGRILCTEMPHTLALLARGVLTPWRAMLLVKESACLDLSDRVRLDAELCADPATLAGLGDRAVGAAARTWCAREDAASVVARRSSAEADRYVTLRPAPDTMAYLTALLPVAQGVAAYKALSDRAAAARSDGDERSRGQMMADALVAGVTGQAEGSPPSVLVNLVMTDHALLDGGGEPAQLPGFGSVPAAAARRMVSEPSEAPGGAAAFVRRLYVAPESGALVAMDSRMRKVPKGLARLIEARDGGGCRMPWCDAPIRHVDHVVSLAEGGETTAENLQGLCEAHNYAKQAPGWRSRPVRQRGWDQRGRPSPVRVRDLHRLDIEHRGPEHRILEHRDVESRELQHQERESRDRQHQERESRELEYRDQGLDHRDGRHRVVTTTPSGHRYSGAAPPLPGMPATAGGPARASTPPEVPVAGEVPVRDPSTGEARLHLLLSLVA